RLAPFGVGLSELVSVHQPRRLYRPAGLVGVVAREEPRTRLSRLPRVLGHCAGRPGEPTNKDGTVTLTVPGWRLRRCPRLPLPCAGTRRRGRASGGTNQQGRHGHPYGTPVAS